MGIYADLLARHLAPHQLVAERKAQLARIAQIRGRDVLVFAANLDSQQPTAIAYSDVLAVRDQLAGKSGKAIDVILETPGGAGDVVEDIVMLLRTKFPTIGVIVPGVARGAGALLALGADEIVMDEDSALGPIDAQVGHQGQTVSAQTLLDGVKRIRDEATRTGAVNAADLAILKNVSPADLRLAEQACDHARRLVADWLVRYQLKGWRTDSATSADMSDEGRRVRVRHIADQLMDRDAWRTHDGSITIADLRGLGLTITDVGGDPELRDAVRRYFALLHITWAAGVFKIIETPTSEIVRVDPTVPVAESAAPPAVAPQGARLSVQCVECGATVNIHAPFVRDMPMPEDAIPFPADDTAVCPACGHELHLGDARRQIEAQARRPIVS